MTIKQENKLKDLNKQLWFNQEMGNKGMADVIQRRINKLNNQINK
jgi:cell shape-determining protein MreC